MRLRDVAMYLGLDNINVPDIEVKNLQYDSRRIQPEDLFVALVGVKSDGHDYIEKAIAQGAAAVLAERPMPELEGFVPILYCHNTRKATALLSALWHNFPDRNMRMIGVTGTNGKTTTTHLIKWVWDYYNINSGLIGTIQNSAGAKILPASHTTPEPVELGQLLAMMRDDNCANVVMEVSSHALKQNRVEGFHFDGAVFTNLTQDHLDFHGNFEDYLQSKIRLFTMLNRGDITCKYGVINIDDAAAPSFIEVTKVPIWTYSIKKPATLQASEYHVTPKGTSFTLLYRGAEHQVEVPLTGQFNVYNVLAAMAVLLAEGMELGKITEALAKAPQVAGRFEKVDEGQNFTVIVDYAHTPDGLENVLTTARGIAKNRLITVFGCGGDRDRTKRPIMGRIAGKLSDYVIITSDNPRTEEPMDIIAEIEPGIKGVSQNYEIDADRRTAIRLAIKKARQGDVVVIAGKGHEDYQLVKGQVLSFDDRKVAREILRESKK